MTHSPYSCRVVAAVLKASPLCVIDAGAAGGPQHYWLEHRPGALLRGYGFEPSPQNLKAIPPSENWTYFPWALSNRDGEATFNANETVGSLERRVDLENTGRTFSKIDVQVRSLGTLRRTSVVAALDVIKTDVENHDLRVLEGALPYLADETLCATSEFSFLRAVEGSNFAAMDRLLNANGFLLFGLASKTGALGEIAGGDFLYLRDPGTILTAPLDAPTKRERLVKLFVLALLFHLPRLAYIVAQSGRETEVLHADEAAEMTALVLRDTFLPAIAPELRRRHAWAGVFSVLAQIASGRKWDGKAGQRPNSLRVQRWLFMPSRYLPAMMRARYRRYLERSYTVYRKVVGIRYAAAGRAASSETRPPE